jgi:hypothetical protein
MKYKVIKLEDNKSILVDESAEIREGDWFLRDFDNIITKANVNSDHKLYKSFKIIVTINHYISLDVPMVIVEDEVDGLKLLKQIGYDNPYITVTEIWIAKEIHKAAQEKGVYSEDDLINAAKYGYEFRDTTSFPEHKFEDSCINNFKQHLQSIKQKDIQEYIELEMVIDLDNLHNYRIKTSRKRNGQLIAYIKH